MDQDIRALREEVGELKKRLSQLEAKLAALPPAALFTAAVPPATATEQVASKAAPLAFLGGSGGVEVR